VTPRASFSAQTLAVLAALSSEPSLWQHGYSLARQTGLKSGSLYPILIRLADRGLVEACWEDEPQQGRPRRHLYRLTSDGLARAATALSEATAKADAAQAARKPRQRARTITAVSGTAPGTTVTAAP
jgi:PadR family transcriptional regulator, regulatory protein PadR